MLVACAGAKCVAAPARGLFGASPEREGLCRAQVNMALGDFPMVEKRFEEAEAAFDLDGDLVRGSRHAPDRLVVALGLCTGNLTACTQAHGGTQKCKADDFEEAAELAKSYKNLAGVRRALFEASLASGEYHRFSRHPLCCRR